jgi:hypothetical protein
MNEGKRIRVKVRTIYATYTGDLFIPAKRKRLSDVINEPDPIFINLTHVEMDGSPDRIKHCSLNKYLIESIIDLNEEESSQPIRKEQRKQSFP